jgi:hypothetical protein
MVIRSLPAKCTMYPSLISWALCLAGITAGESSTEQLPTVSNEANSSSVSVFGAMINYGPF